MLTGYIKLTMKKMVKNTVNCNETEIRLSDTKEKTGNPQAHSSVITKEKVEW